MPTTTDNKTAILLFTRTSAVEALEKRFVEAGSYRTNKLVANNIINRAIFSIKATQLPYFIITEDLQEGITFGEKITNAIQLVFSEGFQNVLVVGNDCLQLSSNRILEAARYISDKDFVIGANKKGGAYLIGVNKDSFCNTSFSNVRWQTKNVANDLTKIITDQNLTSTFLPILSDINNQKELLLSIKFLSPLDAVRNIILSIVASLNKVDTNALFKPFTTYICTITGLRGPPAFG